MLATAQFTISVINDGRAYALQPSSSVIIMEEDGDYKPSQLSFQSVKFAGASEPSSYSGRFKIETTGNETNWSTVYTSSSNESSTTYNMPSTIENKTPYILRPTGGENNVGSKAFDTIVGGTVAWNQLISPVTNGSTANGITYTVGQDNIITTSGTKSGSGSSMFTVNTKIIPIYSGHKYLLIGCASGGAESKYRLWVNENNVWPLGSRFFDVGNGAVKQAATDGTVSSVQIQVVSNDVDMTGKVFRPLMFDLTQMFGSTIADYVYSLEQSHAGDGVAWFRKLLPKSYYPYDAGTLKSVEGVSAHVMVGFNAFDISSSVVGERFLTDGSIQTSTDCWRSDYIPVVHGTQYQITGVYSSLRSMILYYDADKVFISRTSANAVPSWTITTPDNCAYIGITQYKTTGDTYVDTRASVCCHLVWSGYRNGEYEPYIKHSYPLDDSLTLRGIPKLDANNNLYYDGDIYESDGTVTRKYGVVDLGTLNWEKSSSSAVKFNATVAGMVSTTYPNRITDFMLSNGKYTIKKTDNAEDMTTLCDNGRLIIYDGSYETAQAFRSSLNNVYLLYPLATPTTESVEPFQSPQTVDPYGTEEYVTTGIVPVGHTTKYTPNISSVRCTLYAAGGTTTLLDQQIIPIVNDAETAVHMIKQIEEYRLSDSSTSITGSGAGYEWAGTMPTVTSGKYLWKRFKSYFSNGTIVYSDAVCDIVMAGVMFDVDQNKNAITSKVWQSDISSSISSYDSSTTQTIRDRVTQTETNITGITSRVSSVESTTTSLGTRMTSAESSITQNANNIALMVSVDGTSSSLTLTNNMLTAMTSQFVVKDPQGSATIISGGKIHANAITTGMLATNAIKSTNYNSGTANQDVPAYNASSNPYHFSTTGTFLDLVNGNIYSPNFSLINSAPSGSSVSVGAYFNGTINATDGKIGDEGQSYWEIGTTYDSSWEDRAAIIAHGNSLIQTGKFTLSNDRLNSLNSGNYIFYNNYWYDFGIQVPDFTATGSIDGTTHKKNFLYIRRTTSEPNENTLDSAWDYLFRVESNGDIYWNGHNISEGTYLPLSGGTLTGNLTIGSSTTNKNLTVNGNATVTGTLTATASAATQWASAQKVYVALGTASTTTTIQGGSSSAQTIGVNGTLGVGNGGTGKASWTANQIVYASASNTLSQISSGTSGQVLKSNGSSAPGWVNQSSIAAGSATNDSDGNAINTTYRKLSNNQFDTIDVTELSAGNLIVTGAARFTNGLYGNASSATKVNNALKIQLNSGTTEGTSQFTFDGSAAKTVNITKSSVGLSNVENTALSTWAGSSNLTTASVGTLAAAATKAVDTSISASSTSANLPTSAAVAAFVEGKGYVTSSGVTSARVQATSPVVSSQNTAQSSTLNTTISLADAYGDTKNPYGTKTANYVLAGPSSGSAAAPAFRALVAADIPTLAASKVGLGNVTNNKQVKGLSSGTTSGHIVTWGSDGYTVADSGIASGSVTTKINLAGSDYSASSNTITITQANLQSAVQSNSLVLMTSDERSKLSSIQVSEGGTIDFSGVTASAPLTATVGTDKTVNITHNTSGISAGTYRSVTVNTYGHVTAGTNPTTLSGYGITDAKIANGVITLGSNTITPLTASSTLDATKLSGTASISTTGNAGTATKFNSNRTIALTSDVTGSASSDGTNGWSIAATVADNSHNHVPSNITSQNDYTSGSLDMITAAYIGSATSNKSFGLPASAITIEYSTDGGSTWTTYPASDNAKRDLFNETRAQSFYLGNSATKSTDNQLRVTIEPTDRYTSFHGLYCWFSTSGNTCVCDLERSTIGAKNTFSTVFTNRPISGWAGNNINYFSSGTFGGSSTQTGNAYKYRVTFRQTALSTNTANAAVYDIRFLGYNVWTTPNNMVSRNHMYAWDRDFNVTFPAQVTATQFNGNATSATSATSATKATQDGNGAVISSTYLKLSGGTMTGALKTNGTDIILGATGTGNAPNDSGDLEWRYGTNTEKMRLWAADTYTTKHGPSFRLYNENNQQLYNGTLPLADGTDATGTWGISITGNAATATKATQDGNGATISSTYAKLSGATFTGAVSGTSFSASSYVSANGSSSGTAGGLALYGTDPAVYGIAMRTTANGGKHGYVQSDWAIYSYISGSNASDTTGSNNRGWILKNSTRNTTVASVSGAGNAVFNGSVTVGGNTANTSGMRMEYDATLQCTNFVFN